MACRVELLMLCLAAVFIGRHQCINYGDQRVRLVENGYEGIVVAIAEGADEEHKDDIINNIKVGLGLEPLFYVD